MTVAANAFSFDSIDGGVISLTELRGQTVLVVNTASQCGFTGQYNDLQALHEKYAERGLVVLAVPSDDFNQELADEAAVKEFCELNFGLTIPMTEITHIRGEAAHPFYAWLRDAHGFAPKWNFDKVLLDEDGSYVTHFRSTTRPTARAVTQEIEALLYP